MASQHSQMISVESADHKPNSGMREGDISHAEVNAEIRRLSKTVMFGQQNRLRNGFLMDDEVLPRFYAGHPLVLFFYRGLHRLPDHLIDAFFKNGISVTLVGGKDLLIYQNVTTYARSQERLLAYESGQDLLVFKDVRNHQALHIGFTRKTIYVSEGFLREAINQGYASWAISSVLISQGWPLLDYLLILDFVRSAQKRLRTHFTLGTPSVIKRALRRLNTHLVEADRLEDSTFDMFFRHYCNHFLTLNRSVIQEDPYVVADRIFDEAQARVWADARLHRIARAFQYPATFHVNRDIVHQMVMQAARSERLPVEPQTPEDMLHDLRDAAEFNIDRHAKSNVLIDLLLERGEPGIVGFLNTVAEEEASHNRWLTRDFGDDYFVVDVFKTKLGALSSCSPEDEDSICCDFDGLLRIKTLRRFAVLINEFVKLPGKERHAHLPYLKMLMHRIVRAAHAHEYEKRMVLEEIVNSARRTGRLLKLAKTLLERDTREEEKMLLVALLSKLDRHPAYQSTILSQVQALTGDRHLQFGTTFRYQVDTLHRLVPDEAYRKSSDPQGLRNCLHRFETLQKINPDSQELLTQLAGVFVRLDRDEQYEQYIDQVVGIGVRAKPALQDVLNNTSQKNQMRKNIRQTAEDLLRRL